jgi:hypothetical protein
VTIEWRDPPAKQQKRAAEDEATHWTHELKPLLLQKNLERWAMVKKYKTSGSAAQAAQRFRTNDIPGLPPGRWDATARAGELFVRYLGES